MWGRSATLSEKVLLGAGNLAFAGTPSAAVRVGSHSVSVSIQQELEDVDVKPCCVDDWEAPVERLVLPGKITKTESQLIVSPR